MLSILYAGWSGYLAEKARFLTALTQGAAAAGLSGQPNVVVYGGDRFGHHADLRLADWCMFFIYWKNAGPEAKAGALLGLDHPILVC